MPKWTIEEEVILVYYASRQIKNATIVKVLAKKCPVHVRTEKQISRKAGRLRIACGQKEVVIKGKWPAPVREWDRRLADQWLFSKMEKAKLEELLDFDGETAAIIDEVSSFLRTSAEPLSAELLDGRRTPSMTSWTSWFSMTESQRAIKTEKTVKTFKARKTFTT